MVKLIIKNPNGLVETKVISENSTFSPTSGQQFYFDNSDGSRQYTFNLKDGESSIELVFSGNGERIVIVLENMADFIKASDGIANEKEKTVLGIMNDQDGLKELNETALNYDFEGDNVISQLKELLADTNNPDPTFLDGIIIDGFGALAEQLDAAAAGGEVGDTGGLTNNPIDPSGQVNSVVGRGRGSTFDPANPNGEVDAEEDSSPLLIIGDRGTVYEVGLLSSSDNSDIYNGSFSIDSPDGISLLTVAGVDFTFAELLAMNTTPSPSINVGEGEIVITGFTQITANLYEVQYEYTLLDNVNHSGELDDGDATNNSSSILPSSSIAISVRDNDGDTADAELNLNIVDDTPNANIEYNEEELPTLTTLDEETIGTNESIAKASFSGLFDLSNVSLGADNDSSATSNITYTLAVETTSTGLTHAGELITVSVDSNGDIIGTTTSGIEVFKVSVDATSGEVSLTQYEEIDHNAPDNMAGGTDEIIGLANGNVVLYATAIVTDSDEDTATGAANVDISNALQFEDDEPTIKNNQSDLLVKLDESDFDSGILGQTSATISASVISGLFTYSVGADDSAGSIIEEYSLVVTDGAKTGLYLAGNSSEILLKENNDGSFSGYVDGDTTTNPVFTISINSSTGEVTITQYQAMEHSDDADVNADVNNDGILDHEDTPLNLDDLINIKLTITDADKDTVSATSEQSLDIRFLDDGPEAGINVSVVENAQENGNNIVLSVDESAGVNAPADDNGDRSSQADFSNMFSTINVNGTATADYGTDGAGNVSYALSLVNTTAGTTLTTLGSGLYALDANDTVTTDNDGIGQGEEIIMSVNASGVIEGKTSDGTVYFTIEINGNGEVTFTQTENIWHSDTSDDNDVEGIALDALANNEDVAIVLTQTVRDADGDSDSASVKLVSSEDSEDVAQFNILDDGPEAGINVSVVENAQENGNNIVLSVDESAGVNAPADDNGDRSSQADFSNMFSTINVNGTATADYGTDGAGNVSYALSLVNTTAGTTLTTLGSGLYALDANDTVTTDNDGIGQGEEIIMSVNASGIIEGKTSDGTVYFTIEINGNGEVTFTQTENIWHSDTSDDNDVEGIALDALANNEDVAIVLTQTVRDADGDSDSASVKLVSSEDSEDVAQFNILDDGPEAGINVSVVENAQENGNNIVLSVDESAGVNAPADDNGDRSSQADFSNMFSTINVNGTATADYGTDGAGNVSYALSLVNTTAGTTLTTLGSGLYALDANDTVTTDNDGIGQGEEIIMSVNASGVIEGKTSDGTVYFTIEINGNGEVTFTQTENIWHSDTSDDNDVEGIALDALANNEDVAIVLTQTVRDADGDSDSASVKLVSSEDSEDVAQFNILDDGPEAGINVSVVENAQENGNNIVLSVDESAGVNAPADDNGDRSSQADFSNMFSTINVNGTATADYGTDGAGNVSYALSLVNTTAGTTLTTLGSGLYALDANDTVTTDNDGIGQGEEIIMSVNASGVIEGKTSDGTVYFTIEINGNGEVTFTQTENIWHSDTSDDNDVEGIALDALANNEDVAIVLTQTVRDADGDSDSASVKLVSSEDSEDVAQFNILDDGPEAGINVSVVENAQENGNNIVLSVDESAGVNAPADDNGDRSSQADFSNMFSTINVNGTATADYGTDGAGNVSYALSLVNTTAGTTLTTLGSGLYALDANDTVTTDNDGIGQGEEIIMSVNASGVIEGKTSDGTVYFTIEINGNGEVTFTQTENIWHSDTSDDNDVEGIALDALANNEDVAIVLTQTVRDADGDSDSASVKLVSSEDSEDVAQFNILDDGPEAGINVSVVENAQENGNNIVLSVDESAGVNAPADDNGDRSSQADFSNMFSTINVNGTATADYGTDGAGNVSYALSLVNTTAGTTLTTLGSGLYALDANDTVTTDNDGIGQGEEIIMSVNASGVIEGKTSDGTVYFTIEINGNGEVTFTQTENIWHSDTSDDNDVEGIALDALANNEDVAIVLTQTVRDADGDSDSASVKLVSSEDSEDVAQFNILDDGPEAGINVSVVENAQENGNNIVLSVDESAGVNAPADDNGDRSSQADFSNMFSTINVNGTATADYGTDGAGNVSYALSLVNTTAGTTLTTLGSGLYALDANDTVTTDNDGIGQGEEIIMSVNASGIIEGKTSDGTVYFTIEINGNGEVTFTQTENIWHSDTSDDNDVEGIALDALANNEDVAIVLTQTVRDADGDSDSASVKLVSSEDSEDVAQFNILDDGPEAGINDLVKLDDDTMQNGNNGGVEDDIDSSNSTGTLNFDFGTDGIGSIELTGIDSNSYELTATPNSDGTLLSIYQDQGGANPILVATINVDSSTGDYTVTQEAPISHPTLDGLTGDDTENNIEFAIRYDVKDADGDTSSGSLNINIDDDMPEAEDVSTTVEVDSKPVNLVFTLDISGSMGNDVAGTTKDRLEIAKESIEDLISAYESQGREVLVQINTFSTTAFGNGVWMNASEVATYLTKLSDGGSTNYEDALEETEDSYSLSPNGGDTYVYFLSDGYPTREINDGAAEESGYLDGARVTEWNNFINDSSNNIAGVYSVGIGTNVSTTYLSLISSNVIEVDNPADLSSTLQGTVVSASGAFDFSFGADGAADGSGVKLDGDNLAFTWNTPTAKDIDGNDVSVDWTISSDGQTITGRINGDVVIKVEARDITTNPRYEITQLDKDSGIDDLVMPFTITDGDGDSVTANLNIGIDDKPTINPNPDLNDPESTVYERGLNDSSDDSEKDTGVFKITSLDGIAQVEIGGTTFTNAELLDTNNTNSAPIDTVEGTLIITGYDESTGLVSYEYTLKDNLDHLANSNEIEDDISLKIVDSDGDEATGTLTVTIIDDVPVANADVRSMNEKTDTLSGNVYGSGQVGDAADDIGADSDDAPVYITGITKGSDTTNPVSGNVGSSFDGEYGTITLNADGSYTYDLDNGDSRVLALDDGQTLTEEFTYTITDSDGDTSTTTLTITINGKTDNEPPVVTDVSVRVSDEGLSNGLEDTTGENVGDDTTNKVVQTGSVASDLDGDALTVKLTAPTSTLTSEGKTVVWSGEDTDTLIGKINNGTASNPDWQEVIKIEVDSNGDYTVTQSNQIDHPTNSVEDVIGFDVTVLVEDAKGATDTGTLNVVVEDDMPEAEDVSTTVEVDSKPVNLVFTLDISGSMGNDVAGTTKDRLEIAKESIEDLISAYESQGREVLVQINTFSTTAFGNGVWMNASEVATYLTKLSDGGSTNYEDALEETEDSYSLSPNGGDTYVYFLSDGYPTREINDGAAEESGYLDGARVTEWNNFINDSSNNIAGVYSVGIGTNVSTTYLSLISSNVIEVDNPADLSSTLQGTVVSASGAFDFSFGADGAADGSGVKLDGDNLAFTWNTPTAKDIDGNDVSVDWTISSDGQTITGRINGDVVIKVEARDITTNPRYEITQLDKDSGIDDLVMPFTITDGDGDSVTANLNIGIDDKPTINPNPDLNDPESTVYERGLNDSSDDSEKDTGVFKITSLDGIAQVEIGGTTFTNAELLDTNNTNSAPIDTVEGTLIITGYDESTGLVSYEYTLKDNLDHLANSNEIEDDISLKIVDSDGDEATGTLTVTIIDDVPVANADVRSMNEKTDTLSGNVYGSGQVGDAADDIGADSDDAPVYITGITKGSDTTNPVSGNVGSSFDGEYGTITLNADGSYTYDLDNGDSRVLALDDGQTLTEEFTYTITDSDGDTSTTTLTITINGKTDNEPPVVTDVSVRVSDEGLSNGLEDTTGENVGDDTTNKVVQTGSVASDLDGDALTVKLTAPTSTLTSEGKTVVWSGEDTDTLIGKINNGTASNPDWQEVIKIEVDSNGDYTVTQSNQIDHPTNSVEDVIGFDVTVLVEDAKGATDTGTLNVVVEDDMPEAEDVSTTVEVDSKPVNLVFTLDISGSMGNDVAGTTKDRLEIAKESIEDLISAYESQGREVLVQINTFSTTAFGNGVWMNASEVATYLTKLSDGGSTNYEDALEETEDSYSLSPNGGDTYVYFLSDGYPTREINDGAAEESGYLDGARVTEWNNFINDSSNNIAGVYSVGIGTNVSTTYLSLISSNVIEVDNPADLSSTLQGTVVSASGAFDFSFGADGAADGSGVKLDGDNLAFTWNTPTAKDIDGNDVSVDWTISSDGQTITGRINGDVVIKVEARDITTNPRYEITQLDKDSGIDDLVMPFTITDGDGDSVTANLNIGIDDKPTINPNPDLNDPESTVYERGLNDSSDDSEKDTGVFKITSLDGIAQVEIGGTTFTNAELLDTNNTNSAPIDTVEGTLIITGYDESTGLVSYEYTLKDNLDHLANSNEIEDDISLKIVDSDGDEATGTLTVTIIDDVPVANADVRSMNEKTDTLSGNVYGSGQVGDAADDIGADSDDAPVYITGITKGSDTTNPVSGNVGSSFDGEYGTITLNADGSYTYDLDNGDSRVLALDDGQTLTEEFTYTITDSDGDTSTTTLTITINGKTDNEPPVVTDVSVRVSDEGLSNGLEDTTGENVGDDTTNKVVQTGSVASDLDGDALTVKLTAPTSTLTSEGKTVVWSGEDTDTLIGKINNGTASNPDWQEVIKIEVDSNGDYTVTQSNQIDHPTNSVEDVIGFDVTVLVEDAKGATDTGTLNVVVEDDMPEAEDVSTTVEVDSKPVNLVFTLDISGSMGNDVAGTTKDRLEIAKESIEDLISAYESQGREVLVQINTFSTTAFGNGVWMNASEVATYLTKLSDGGSTNYEDALEETEDSYSLSPNGGDTYVYFLSDGYPTREINDGAAEESGYLDGARVTEWNNFINDSSNNIAGVYSVGIGTNVSTTYLSLISSNVIEVDNPADLSSTLQGTVVSASGAFDFSFGADGAADGSGLKLDGGKEAFNWGDENLSDGFDEIIVTGSVGTITWSYANDGSSDDLTTLIGKNSSGEVIIKLTVTGLDTATPGYTITELDKDAGIETLIIPYTVTDGDGDSATANLNITINAPIDANVITCEDISYTFTLADFDSDATSVRIDSLPVLGTILLDGVAIAAPIEISSSDIDSGKLTFVPDLHQSGRDEYNDSGTGDQLNDYAQFNFSVSTDNSVTWTSTSSIMTIDVSPVADAPTLSVLGSSENTTTIDLTNVNDTSNGYTVKAYYHYDNDGDGELDEAVISIVSGTSHDGFGVQSTSPSGDNPGNKTEINYHPGEGSEVIAIEFENALTSVDISYAWKHNYNTGDGDGEVAIVEFYKDGVKIDSQEHYDAAQTDTIDGPYTFALPDGGSFDEIRISAKQEGDDFLIHDVTFTELVSSQTELTIESGDDAYFAISSQLVDLDGSESFKSIIIDNLPEGFTISDGTHTFTASAALDYVDVKSWDMDAIKVSVPDGITPDEYVLTITAKTEESLNGEITPADPDNCSLEAQTSVEFKLIVPDSLPTSYDETNSLVFGDASTNLLFTLDVSGSMNNSVKDSSNNWTTRFEIAKASIISTIQAYAANGETEVNLTLFNSCSANFGWMSTSQAISFLNDLSMNSNNDLVYSGSSYTLAHLVNNNLLSGHATNYYLGLEKTMDVDFNGHDADSTIAYFLSDGYPNSDSGKINEDSDQTIIDWSNYVSNNIDKLNVIGVSSGAKEESLKIVQVQDGDEVLIVTDDSTLGNVLVGTVTASVNGNVLENISSGDGEISIDSIEIDGNTYTSANFPSSGVELDGDGTLKFDFTSGDYTYTAKSSEFSSDTSKVFSVTASDEDGDSTIVDVTIEVDLIPTQTENIIDLVDTDTIDLTGVLSANTDAVDMTNSSVNNLEINVDDLVIDDDKELKIFGDSDDKVTLEGGDSNWTSQGKEEINGEVFNVYQGTDGTSNIKILIDEDVSIEPDL